jgi:hypothetical protein
MLVSDDEITPILKQPGILCAPVLVGFLLTVTFRKFTDIFFSS